MFIIVYSLLSKMKFAKPMILPSIPTPVFMFLVFLMRTSKLCFFFFVSFLNKTKNIIYQSKANHLHSIHPLKRDWKEGVVLP